MPRLEELKIRCGPEYSDQANLMLPGFIRRNRQVKKIYLKFASLNNVVLDAMHLWLDHGAFECLAIQLEVSDDFAMYNYIAKLEAFRNLRELDISCANFGFGLHFAMESLARGNTLRTLSIGHAKVDADFCTALKKFTNLETLKLVKLQFFRES